MHVFGGTGLYPCYFSFRKWTIEVKKEFKLLPASFLPSCNWTPVSRVLHCAEYYSSIFTIRFLSRCFEGKICYEFKIFTKNMSINYYNIKYFKNARSSCNNHIRLQGIVSCSQGAMTYCI